MQKNPETLPEAPREVAPYRKKHTGARLPYPKEIRDLRTTIRVFFRGEVIVLEKHARERFFVADHDGAGEAFELTEIFRELALTTAEQVATVFNIVRVQKLRARTVHTGFPQKLLNKRAKDRLPRRGLFHRVDFQLLVWSGIPDWVLTGSCWRRNEYATIKTVVRGCQD